MSATDPKGECVKESDGYHVHTYLVHGEIGRFRIEHHLHAWMDEHKQLYPEVKDVDAETLRHDLLGYWDTVEEAWVAMKVDGPIPVVSCRD